jgi:hypothetical protein
VLSKGSGREGSGDEDEGELVRFLRRFDLRVKRAAARREDAASGVDPDASGSFERDSVSTAGSDISLQK